MSCVYYLHNKDTNEIKEYTYLELVQLFQNSNYRDFSDIVYSKGSKQDAIFSEVLDKKKDYKAKLNENRLSGEPDYTKENTFTTQTFIDSGHFRFKGRQLIEEQRDEDYIKNAAESFKRDDNLSDEEALLKAQKTLEAWQIINDDAKTIHSLLNSFSFQTQERYDFIKHLEESKFENFSSSIYDQVLKLFHIMRDSNKMTNEATVKIVQNINLLAQIRTLGKDIIGHIDNLVIDTNGTLHIYNYKLTSTPISEWDAAKKRKYYFQMALLKQILAYNGFNIKGTELHIVPIRVEYSNDYSTINNVIIYAENNLKLPMGQAFNEYETAARYFIKNNVKLEPLQSKTRSKINRYLQDLFPQRNINIDGIQKSVEEWIKFNYSSKWENRIKRVDNPDYTYEVYLNDNFTDPILIKDPSEPLQNDELKEQIAEHIQQLNSNNTEFLSYIVKEILVSKRKGKPIIIKGYSNNRNLQLATNYLNQVLSKYINSYREFQGIKEFEWDLINNDTLTNANILLFRNNYTDQIDVVCLSNYNLRSTIQFNGQQNIMGSYIKDASSDTKGLINFKANFANIEAVKAMTILNEVLPQINQSSLTLGELKVVSIHSSGMAELYDMESLNRDLFQECIKIVKKNVQDFDIVNNFSKARYIDPIKLLISDYQKVLESTSLSISEKQEIKDLGFTNLESLSTREAKKVELKAIIEKIYKQDPSIQAMSPKAIIDSSKHDPNKERRALVNLYILCQNAYCYYSGIQIRNEYKISKIYEYGFVQNRVPNKTYQGVTSTFTKTVDVVASKVRDEYSHIYNFTMDFYNQSGFSEFRATTLGDQNLAFNNLYKKDKSGNILMEFRNPYTQDSLPPLSKHEKTYLKKVLFELAKIRSEIYGFDFNFSKYDLDNPQLIQFINQNRSWYFNPPLEKASKATIRSRGIDAILEDWKQSTKELISNPKQYFNRVLQSLDTPQESEMMEKAFDTLHLQNSFIMGDGYKGGEVSRTEFLNSKPQGYFETNVENLLAHYLERHIQTKEFNKALISIKGILLQLELLGNTVGEDNKQGILQTIKMIQDYTKQNIFNISIMEPESQKVITWLDPFRQLVSKAYIAGNITSMFRDIFEGMWQNNIRMMTKYQTDIDAKSLRQAYLEVTKASFTSVRNITIIDELCKTYRLSNLDVARISEGLTTSRGGALNVENWMYATLRVPDFLNRMVLFVAKSMKDGCWEAFDLKDNKLVYNWRKDKRYSIYADPSKKGTKEYEEQRIAYYNAIRQYNQENPENTIDFSNDLPVAYSNLQIQQMRQLSNSVYGAYDKSMRAKYEHTALGMTFAMFSTWMNGHISNYFSKPGQYSGGLTQLEQDRDGSGNLLFMDKYGNTVVEIIDNGQKQYIYDSDGGPVQDLQDLVPIMKDIPIVVQGIWYTIKDGIKALRDGGINQFKEDIIANPMQYANLKKLISDMIALMLFSAIFKYAVSPAYKEVKKTMQDMGVVTSAISELMYKSSSRSYDSFLGPVSVISFLGENTNPPVYTLSTKVLNDLGKFVFGDKTFEEMLIGNIAFFRTFQDTYRSQLKE